MTEPAAPPRYEPWIGKSYESGEMWGGRVLVLGLSHYGGEDVKDADFTRVVVERHVASKAHQFFTRVAKRFPGQDAYGPPDSRAAFWHSVAFYNYIQEPAGKAPRQEPTAGAEGRSWPALEGVLKALRPDVILGLGVGLARSLRPRLEGQQTLQLDSGGRALVGRFGEAGPGAGVAGFIAHPMSSAMTREQGRQVVTTLIGTATGPTSE